jgi:hypothetical protein
LACPRDELRRTKCGCIRCRGSGSLTISFPSPQLSTNHFFDVGSYLSSQL